MVSDRLLRRVFGMSAQGVALWGTLIRSFATLAMVLVLAGLAGAYARTARNTIELRQGQDFGIFYDSVRARQRGGPPPDLPIPNLNPPHFDYVVLPFTALDRPTAVSAWFVVSAFCLIGSLVAIIRTVGFHGWAVVWLCALVFAAPPMVAQLFTGQVGLLLLVPFTLAWVSARQGRQMSAGVWIGVCASIKPFFLLFTAYFVVRRWPKAAMASVVTVVLVFGGGLALIGGAAYREWIEDLLSVTWAEHYMNASMLGFLERTLSASEWHQVPIMDSPQLVGPLYATAFVGIAIVTLARVRAIRNIDRQFLLITAAALLLSPLGWVYYLWFLVPPLAATIHGWESVDLPGRGGLVCALLGFLVPPFFALSALSWAGGLGAATAGSVYFWALAALWVSAIHVGRPIESAGAV